MPNARRECLEVMKSPKNTAHSEKFDNRDEGAKKRGRGEADSALENAKFCARCTLFYKFSILGHFKRSKPEYTKL